jgi:Protein of unknown function (DUF3307)
MSGIVLFLCCLTLLQVKHFICDFVLQTAYLYRNKGFYGHPAGFIHAGMHAICSVPAILLATKSVLLLAAIPAAELVIHYHVDWLKIYLDRHFRLDIRHRAYWMIFGADQLIHQLSYVAILIVLARAAPF